ncbi:TRAP transporter small permease, partial [Glaciimonas sp. GG7]
SMPSTTDKHESIQPDFQRRVKIFIHLMVIAFAVLMLWNGFVLADQIVHYMIPNLGISQGFTYYPLILSGVLIILFSIEHICALIFHTKVVPSWH